MNIQNIDESYKFPSHDKSQYQNNLYFNLIDSHSESDIINFKFSKTENGKPIKGTGHTLSKAINSLRTALSRKNSDFILNILNESPILQSLKNIYSCLKSAEIRFGTEKELSDFPYDELCQIISDSNDVNSIINAIECLRMGLRFNSGSLDSKITDKAIESIENLMNDENLEVSLSAIHIIGYLNSNSEELCNHFCEAGLINALIPLLPRPNAIFTIQSSLMTCDYEYSIKFLFLLFKSILSTEDDLIAARFFHGITIFAQRFDFDSIPDQFSDDEIDQGLVIESKKLIYSLLENLILNSVNFELVSNMMDFCMFIPENDPPNILQKLFEYLTDDSFYEDDPNLIAKISTVIIHFYDSWKDDVQRDYLRQLYDIIAGESTDFKISFSYTKLIVAYHQMLFDDFDLQVVELCTRYVCSSDSLFSHLCIGFIYNIVRILKTKGIPEEIDPYIQVLSDARDNFITQLDDPDLNPEDEHKLQYILDESEENEELL